MNNVVDQKSSGVKIKRKKNYLIRSMVLILKTLGGEKKKKKKEKKENKL